MTRPLDLPDNPGPPSADELARMHEALRQSEASRRESQAFFETSFHATPALMAIASAVDGRLIEVNPAMIRACGFSREELVGRTTLEIGLWLHPAQRHEFFEQLTSRGSIRDFEADFRAKSGELRSLLISADLVELGGRPCMLTVGIDVTERRRRERVQAATYEISQAVLEGDDLPQLLARVHCIIGRLMPAKNFYVALLNADGTELSFPYLVDEYLPRAYPRALGNGFTEYILATGKPALVTAPQLAELLSRRGVYQPLKPAAKQRLGAPLLAGCRPLGVIALQDYDHAAAYTEEDLRLLNFVAGQTALAVQRRQAETALARAEQRYRSIFENAVEGLYITSPAGRFISANRALARMFGFDSASALLAAISDIPRQIYVRPERRDEFLALIQKCDEVSDFESEVYRRNGSTFWISESVRVIRNAQGAVDHFEGVAIDVTERHEAARVLQAAKEAADAASRAKSHFLASVSHELRTPLNGILGYTQILQRDPALGDRQRDGVRVIHESAGHLLALINDILDFSKIEAGKVDLHPADFDLREFVAGVERVFAPRAREKGILFESAAAADLPGWVRGDEQRLRQVVFNLISNAVKFTRTGGVVFSVQPPAAGLIRFAVSDTGIGIAPADLGKLFQPFAQVGPKAIAADCGTGLGLAISRNLVERMGGRLQVESRPGAGSRFWFDVALPVTTVAAAPTPAAPARRIVGYAGTRRRILVVDDNTANRGVLIEMLAPLGFELAAAADGPGALVQAQGFQPDLVLMDLRLPGAIDGLEATRRLRAAEGATPPRRRFIVAVSASAYDQDRRECIAAGCDDFLAKPFREEQLWAILERLLGLQWIQAEPVDAPAPPAAAVTAPPPAAAAAIYDLAMKGDLVGIREQAQALLGDPAAAAFAQRVLELVARFRMKAVRQFAASYLPEDSVRPHA